MKSILFILLFCLVLVYDLNSKKLPTVAAKVPSALKEAIYNQLDYPNFAKDNNIEGEVYFKFCVSKASMIKIIDLSATNVKLGNYVKQELSSIYIEKPKCKEGQEYYLKIVFQLTHY